MDTKLAQCKWCRGLFPDMDGPVHAYVESSPGCWHTFGLILAKEYSDPFFFMDGIHAFTTHSYMVQHPNMDDPRALQSVNGHLLALYCMIELEKSPSFANKILANFVEAKAFDRLSPPSFEGSLNINHVLESKNREDHARRTIEWAQEVYHLWKPIAMEFLERNYHVLTG